ncbi:MAG: hypothetical protein AAGI11_19190 [Pseudomonadota bacterium]
MLALAAVVGVAALAATLTRTGQESDPCAEPQQDISAAVLADEQDQDAMINRAMLVRAECEGRQQED